MSGTKAGGVKAKAKNLAKDPNFYSKIGKIGGARGTTGGFYANRELAREAGRKGGLVSRRGKSKKVSFDPQEVDFPPKDDGGFLNILRQVFRSK